MKPPSDRSNNTTPQTKNSQPDRGLENVALTTNKIQFHERNRRSRPCDRVYQSGNSFGARKQARSKRDTLVALLLAACLQMPSPPTPHKRSPCRHVSPHSAAAACLSSIRQQKTHRKYNRNPPLHVLILRRVWLITHSLCRSERKSKANTANRQNATKPSRRTTFSLR